MQPALGLTYSSERNPGHLGVGFELSGMSSISRCGQELDFDGVTSTVRFDEDDRLCLDGVRLLVLGTPEDYWKADAEYRLADGSSVRVRAVSGGTRFEVTQRDGTRSRYGGPLGATVWPNYGDRGVDGKQESAETVALAWRLARSDDVVGNYIEYIYDQRSFGDYGYEHRLTEIRYTGNATHLPRRKIEFVYGTRSHVEQRFFSGTEQYFASLVKEIRVSVRGSLVRTYVLNYEESASGRDRLRDFTECDRFSICRPPTRFEWTEPHLDISVHTALKELPMGWTQTPWEQTVEFADLDGDGRDEMIYADSSDANRIARLWIRKQVESDEIGGVTGDGTPVIAWVWGDPIDTGLRLPIASYSLARVPIPAWFVPFDNGADGTMELLVRQPVDATTSHPEVWDLYEFNGHGLALLERGVLGCTNGFYQPVTPLTADFTGDGAPDVVGGCANGPPLQLDWRIAHFDWDEALAGAEVPLLNGAVGQEPMYGWRVVLDVDGDRRPEILSVPWLPSADPELPTPEDGLVSVLGVGTPKELLPAVHLPLEGVDGLENIYVFADINGDGLSDAITTDVSLGLSGRMNTGRGFGRAQSALSSVPSYLREYRRNVHAPVIQVADFNRDGRDDLLVPFPSGPSGTARVVLHLSDGSRFARKELPYPGDSSRSGENHYTWMSHVRVLDSNGDGQLEYSQARDGKLETVSVRAVTGDLLRRVQDGASVPELAYGMVDNPGCGASYPQGCARHQRVVSWVRERTSEGGSTYQYTYGGGRVDNRRNDGIGFAWRETADPTAMRLPLRVATKLQSMSAINGVV